MQLIWRFDYAGIVVLIVTSFVPPVYYGFLCEPLLRNFYLLSTLTLGASPFGAAARLHGSFGRLGTPLSLESCLGAGLPTPFKSLLVVLLPTGCCAVQAYQRMQSSGSKSRGRVPLETGPYDDWPFVTFVQNSTSTRFCQAAAYQAYFHVSPCQTQQA